MKEENRSQVSRESKIQDRGLDHGWRDQLLPLMLYDPPDLKGEMAVQLIYFFRELLESLERHYSVEVKEYEEQQNQLDLKLPF